MTAYISEIQQRKKQKITYVAKTIKVEIPAGGAAITPPLGPVLGQYGMNTMEFCKEFNEESKLFEKDTIVPTIIYLALDKSFYFELKTPGVAYFIKKYLESNEIEKKNNIYILEKQSFLRFLYEVALLKLTLFIPDNLRTAIKIKHKDEADEIQNDNAEKSKTKTIDISSFFLKNYMRSMLGTARSFGIKMK